MPRHNGTHNDSIKFDCPKELRQRFIKACEWKVGPRSQSDVLRLAMLCFCEEVEEEQRGYLAGVFGKVEESA